MESFPVVFSHFTSLSSRKVYELSISPSICGYIVTFHTRHAASWVTFYAGRQPSITSFGKSVHLKYGRNMSGCLRMTKCDFWAEFVQLCAKKEKGSLFFAPKFWRENMQRVPCRQQVVWRRSGIRISVEVIDGDCYPTHSWSQNFRFFVP